MTASDPSVRLFWTTLPGIPLDRPKSLEKPMHNRKPPPDMLLFRAVEARAAGKGWATVGELVGRSPRTVAKWPQAYSERWEAALRAAARSLIDVAAAHAVGTLQNLLVSEDERIRAEAAWRLIYQRLEQWKIDVRLFLTEPAGNQTQDDPHTQSIRNLSREQRLLLLASQRTIRLPALEAGRDVPVPRAG